MSFLSLFSDALSIWKRAAFKFFAINLFILTPYSIIETMHIINNDKSFQLIGFAYSMFSGYILQALFIHLAIMYARGQEASISESLNVALSKFGLIFKTSFFVMIKLFFGLILIIPGFVWMAKYAFIIPEVMFGSKSVKESMENSAKLTDGIKWSVIFYLLLVSLPTLIISGILGFAYVSINGPIRNSFGNVFIFQIFIYSIIALLAPIGNIFWTVFYLHRRDVVFTQSYENSLIKLAESINSIPTISNQIKTKYNTITSMTHENDSYKKQSFILKK